MTARLSAVVDGPDDAPVLVLGPSLGTDTGLFDAQAAEFAGDFRVVRYDLRGHGGSEVVPGPCTMADLAADVVALLDRLGVDRFSYAGVSIGGAIGQQLALTVPERLEKLAIIASAAQFADPPSWTARAQQVREQGTETLVGSRTGTWFTAAWAEQHPDEALRLLQMLRDTPDEGYAACCEAIGDFDVRDRLGQITMPTLVVAGAEDPATPPDMVRLIADGIPGAQFLVVTGAGHLPNTTDPETVNAALRGHLA
ncbi:3-oxoadipate enol-lactonase [Geodermatophilus sabuli]|uniref:3-oxoadipate enol-lactonase n=1 Tax=Geodermatophilus sabuli TaxID=1564158 RepID=A0A285EE33_9ACTN|nr:3-oxoadipate enol-lactonase [Geodermatophilus sabuli]MBB3086416.1 3-oxoadipate enol-lactonase [Geodermatophilus sabuli]SNX97369.1 3-oxoadipate enol-lactonase [Geodermatophilus sabuli]